MKRNMNVLYLLPYPQSNKHMILKNQVIAPWTCHESKSKSTSLIFFHKIKAKDAEMGRKQRIKGY